MTDEKSMGLLCERATLSESLDQIKVTDDIRPALVMCVVFCLPSIEHGRGIDGNLVRSFCWHFVRSVLSTPTSEAVFAPTHPYSLACGSVCTDGFIH